MHVISVKYSEMQVGLTSHFHDCHQLLYVASGKILASVNDRQYEVDERSLLILSRFEQHSIQVLSPRYKRYTLLISSDSSHIVYDNYLLSSVLVNRGEGFCHAIDLKEYSHIFEALLKNMAAEYAESAAMYRDMLDLMLRQLLITLYRCKSALFLSEINQNAGIVTEIQSLFEQKYPERFTLAQLSEEYHISQSHLAHLFKKITGYAPMEYLQACRISAAKRYLTTTNLSIKEIVGRCGFSDESNFSRMFREKTGGTPSQFRVQYRE